MVRKLREGGYSNIVTRAHAELDLLDQPAVARFFGEERPDYVFLCAGKTGGVFATNTYRADFIYETVTMESNIIHQAFQNEVSKLMYYACSSIYPRHCPQPMNEENILSGHLEMTVESFAVAKIAGLKMCESYNRQYGTDFMTVIPTNLYGPNQRYEAMNSTVIPSLLHRFHQARITGAEKVMVWGTGHPTRDFLYVDDLAEASIFLMNNYEGNMLLNVGTGRSHSIAELVDVIRRKVGYSGDIVYDRSLPDGVQEKLQDIARITSLGWKHKIDLEEGIQLTYRAYLERVS